MIKYRKNKVNQLFVTPGDSGWHGKVVAFENIDSVTHIPENKKFNIYTKQGKEWTVPDVHYEMFLEEYRNWLNNK